VAVAGRRGLTIAFATHFGALKAPFAGPFLLIDPRARDRSDQTGDGILELPINNSAQN
jgi:hypothetical protein